MSVWSMWASACAFVRCRLWAARSWRAGVEHAWTLERACRALVEDAVFAKGCADNCSALVVQFAHPAAE